MSLSARLVLLGSLLLALGSCAEPVGNGRTVVLISLDTLSPWRLGVYGGDAKVSPRLDAFATEAVVFDQALAPSPWTLPSHMTMLTGLDPIAHGIRNSGSGRLSKHVMTLSEILKNEGFATAAFTDGGFVAGKFGFDQGFDIYEDERNEEDEGPNGFARILPEALDWLGDQGTRDVFLFLHTFDVHLPYDECDDEILERFRQRPVEDDPRDYALHQLDYLHQQKKSKVTIYDRMGELLNDYDAGIHEADRGVGLVLDALKESGRYEDALVIITSDHGEAFFERGLHVGHGIALTDNELRVPLIVRFPQSVGAGQRHDDLVGLVDVARTALDSLGIPPDPYMQGESLLGLVRGEPRQNDYLIGASQNTRSFCLVKDGYKYITPVGMSPDHIVKRHLAPMTPPGLTPPIDEVEYELNEQTFAYDIGGDPLGVFDVLPIGEQLYDRSVDPEEHRNLRDDEDKAEILDRMRRFFQAKQKESEAIQEALVDDDDGQGVVIDRAEQQLLAALGYISTGDPEDLKSISPKMRKWIKNPPKPPPGITELTEIDRAVHAVRARSAAGASLTADDRRELRSAAQDYVKWMAGNRHQQARKRAGWRLRAIYELLVAAGDDVELVDWYRSIERSVGPPDN